jgi:hypothetical protein
MGSGRASEHGRLVIYGATPAKAAWAPVCPSLRRSCGKREPGDGLTHDSSNGAAEAGKGCLIGLVKGTTYQSLHETVIRNLLLNRSQLALGSVDLTRKLCLVLRALKWKLTRRRVLPLKPLLERFVLTGELVRIDEPALHRYRDGSRTRAVGTAPSLVNDLLDVY